jgi:hypothetical protein
LIDVEHLPAKFVSFRSRWQERNDRMSAIVNAVNGIWDVDGPDDEQITNRSPNFVQVALEDTAETASLIPSVRVTPSGPSPEDRDRAAAMERMAAAYLDVSQIHLWAIRSLLDLGAFGLFSSIVRYDDETGGPVMEWRDPRTFFPEPGWKTFDSVREGFFARELYLSQLPEDWQQKVRARWPLDPVPSNVARYHEKKIYLIEYFTEGEWLIGGLYQSGQADYLTGEVTYTPVEFARGENPHGICPIVAGQRISLDNEPRGQFDQVIGLMEAHIRLMGLVLDYADQAVYSDVWVKDLIGPMSFGGAAYIQLGPNGGIGRVPPAQSDITVFRELDTLVDSMHLAARWPKSRPGEIDQAIASAKFLEASAGIMNTVIRTYHLIMKRSLESALRLMFVCDKVHGRPRMLSGVLRNQQFMVERDVSDIDLSARIRVEYGIGLGREPAQSMVLGIQAAQAGLVSQEFVQENFEGIQDVALERSRIDVQKFRDMALAQLLQGLESGSVPKSALVEIARARSNGDDIFDLFEKYLVKPEEDMLAQQMTSGLTGGPVMPGAPPGMGGGGPGMPAPAAPPPEALLGLFGGGPAGGPGEPPESQSRLNVPLGDGSFAGTNATVG